MTTTYLENIERENRAKAVGFTLVISVLVFLLFFYIKIFDFHDDPQYSSEIPVEFGTDNVGSGSV